jgi:hypothetical protein
MSMAKVHFTAHLNVIAPPELMRVMGSTTGSLWFSGNSGDSWNLVNAHLPPVYAVKFG